MKSPSFIGFILKTLMIFTIFYMVSGCANTYVTKMYPGPELRKQEIAILKGDPQLIVRIVDGVTKKYTPELFRGPGVYGGFEIHLLPGVHTVSLGYSADDTRPVGYGMQMTSCGQQSKRHQI